MARRDTLNGVAPSAHRLVKSFGCERGTLCFEHASVDSSRFGSVLDERTCFDMAEYFCMTGDGIDAPGTVCRANRDGCGRRSQPLVRTTFDS